MARGIQRLSSLKVEREKKPGYYADGGGLYLQVTAAGSKSWLFRFTLSGRAREMGLGALHTVGLADARLKAADCRKLLHEGRDPIEKRNQERCDAKLAAAKAITFEGCAEAYIVAHGTGWKNAKHADQWRNTLATYAYPVFGGLSVASIDTALVMKSLEAIWTSKTETASRLRGRIESVLDWATVRDYRHGENPARWKGHLDKLLPARNKVKKVEHHRALPYTEIGDFMASLRGQDGIGARALEFAILTAARSGEVRGATWSELDMDAALWIVPPERMKAKKEHRVPLSPSAITLLKKLPRMDSDLVFPSIKSSKAISDMTMAAALKRMGANAVPHGFRSTFRDWAAEQTNYPRDVAEMALAHTIGDKVEAAYRRGDLFEKRRRMMSDWAKFCATPSVKAGEVVPMKRAMKSA
ncbi:MAG: integrase arm-type DNA-binding domain-containing protein [Sideroxydans sp.]|nr:integrase arm-type DNA-binding domain-containing protein [Sideroxydans sp.]